MKRNFIIWFLLTFFMLTLPVYAAQPSQDEAFDPDAQLDALGARELVQSVPEEAGVLMRESSTYELSVQNLLQLSPKAFFQAIWSELKKQIHMPLKMMGTILGTLILCALMGGIGESAYSGGLGGAVSVVMALCMITSMALPIINCINEVTRSIRDASVFMVSFIPMFSAAMAVAGQPVTGAAYNLFLFGACQIVSQVISGLLVPLMSIYLAFCVVGALVPELGISSATGVVKTVVSWSMGFILTIFVGLLSLQTMVSGSADSMSLRTTKFLIGSFVPVVGSALSEAFIAAQGCLKLVRATVGVYGIIVAMFTFLPVILQVAVWYLTANLAAVAGDVLGIKNASNILKACSSVLGILMAVVICYALLIIVSTTVVLVMAGGVA